MYYVQYEYGDARNNIKLFLNVRYNKLRNFSINRPLPPPPVHIIMILFSTLPTPLTGIPDVRFRA